MITTDVLSAWLMMSKPKGRPSWSSPRDYLWTGKVAWSIQTGSFIYCTPKCDDGPWAEVEVLIAEGGAHPSTLELLRPYGEQMDAFTTNGVEMMTGLYPYLPIGLLVTAINNEAERQGVCVTLTTK